MDFVGSRSLPSTGEFDVAASVCPNFGRDRAKHDH